MNHKPHQTIDFPMDFPIICRIPSIFPMDFPISGGFPGLPLAHGAVVAAQPAGGTHHARGTADRLGDGDGWDLGGVHPKKTCF